MQSVVRRSLAQLITEARARAYEGDEEAADLLMGSLPNHLRGKEVAAAYANGMPEIAFRELLSAGWDQDHLELQRAAKNRGTLRK